MGGVRRQDSGVRIQESGFRRQDSGVRIQDSGFRRLFLFIPPTPYTPHPTPYTLHPTPQSAIAG
ncbi:MAG: hypothetical protein DWQ54_19265 [Microcystis flos-aquae TF09]|uniref:Uncharacterized protein n=1 Tax=Microcystis flos-aquae TF09 TaxID=2060473 RepID=A0A3E0L0I9_9CHRO|nr:MAG: hypothetical protein DWQ54_19265 [Microcystis flos-aquae TF09]